MILSGAKKIELGGKPVKKLKIDGIAIYNRVESWEDAVVLPDYWLECANESLKRAKANRNKMSNDRVEFIFFTDSHWGHNAGNSPKLVKWFKQQLGDMPVLFGGDVIEYCQTKKEDGIAEIKDFMSAFEYNIFCTAGNHDNNDPNKKNIETQKITHEEVYELMNKYNLNMPNSHNITELDAAADKIDGDWFDLPEKKVRFIQFYYTVYDVPKSNNMSRKHLNMMLKNMPDGYRAVAMCHGWGTKEDNMPIEYNGLFPTKNWTPKVNELKVLLMGHTHSEEHATETVKGHTVQDLTERADKSLYDKDSKIPWGTSCTEQNLVIIQIDFTNKKLYKVNVGWKGSSGDRTLDIYD